MIDDGRFCLIPTCPKLRGFFRSAPLCDEHMVEAWRYVEARPQMRPMTIAPPKEPDPKPEPTPFAHVVYYARRPNGNIKIGTTRQLRSRMNTLRVAWDDLLAVEWGGRDLEQQRHAEFSHLRQYDGARRTEEFAEAPDLLEHITRTRLEIGDPLAIVDVLWERNRAIAKEYQAAGPAA